MFSFILLIADPKVLTIPIIECFEGMVDMRESGELIFGPPPETPLTFPHYTRLRKTVFEKLLRVQSKLPNGWKLRLYEGFRSLQVQKLLFDQEFERVRARNPNGSHLGDQAASRFLLDKSSSQTYV